MEVADAHRLAYRRLGGTAQDPALRAVGWDLDGDTVALRYAIDGLGELTETVRFPGVALADHLDAPTAGALDVLHLAALTSYVKAVVPRRVILPTTDPAALRMVTALLDDGLAEFAAINELDLTGWFEVVADPAVAAPGSTSTVADRDTGGPRTAAGNPDDRGVLVPVGGGKDSAVTALLALRAGLDAVAFSVNPRASMQRTATATGLELLTAERRLDPTLLAWNEAGALNGHVPITAIVASIACVAATLTGRGDVLLSNEGSADEPTRTVRGRAVNHQYSKSAAFESLHADALASATGGATRALSVLRPLPELVVAAVFVRLGAPLTAVNSCNRAYTLTGDRMEWCGRCPKCLFVQLMLAPFLSPAAFRAATGFDALADTDLIDRFTDLTDPATKPYECVGTIAEVQLAFDLLADTLAWREHPAVRALGHPGAASTERFARMVADVNTSALPSRYAAPLRDVLAELAA